MGGLSLADVEAFILEAEAFTLKAGGENNLNGKTTEDICKIMKGITVDCSYCEYRSRQTKTPVRHPKSL
jgi:hypothetical protein